MNNIFRDQDILQNVVEIYLNCLKQLVSQYSGVIFPDLHTFAKDYGYDIKRIPVYPVAWPMLDNTYLMAGDKILIEGETRLSGSIRVVKRLSFSQESIEFNDSLRVVFRSDNWERINFKIYSKAETQIPRVGPDGFVFSSQENKKNV